LNYGVRILYKNPGFTAATILTLALGIGANTVMFSIVSAVLLKPLPYPDSDRLVFIHEELQGGRALNVSWPDFQDWRAQSHSFSGMTAIQPERLSFSGPGQPEMKPVAWVSPSFFSLLGQIPMLGRTFSGSEDQPGAARVAVVSYSFWRNSLKGEMSAIGKTIDLDGEAVVVIGVLPPGETIPNLSFDIYLPIRIKSANPNMAHRANHPGILVLAKLRHGATLKSARVEMDSIMERLGAEYPQSNRNETAILAPIMEQIVGGVRGKLLMLLGAVFLVLLLACANVAHMILALFDSRRREFSVRTALGATRARLARQLLAESVLLAFLGGVTGVLLAWFSIRSLVRMYTHPVFGLSKAHVDGRVLLFAVGACFFAAVVFGLTPVLSIRRTNINRSLKQAASSGSIATNRRLRSALIIGEVAAALVLSIGAALLLRSLSAVMSVDPGFRADHLLALDVIRPGRGVNPEQNLAFFSEAIDHISHLPGVTSASAAMFGPLAGTPWTSPYAPEDHPVPPGTQQPWTAINMVWPGYFQTMQTPLIEGRLFTNSDRIHSVPVAIVNQAMARSMAARGKLIGRRLFVRYAANPVLEIVGIVGNIKQRALDQPNMPEVYVPVAQMPASAMTIVVRTSVEPDSVAHSVALSIQDLDKRQSVTRIVPLSTAMMSGIADRTFVTFLLVLFSALALLMAITGVSGVMTHTITQLWREIGIRMALGAQNYEVLRFVLKQGMWPALAGIVIGLGATWGTTQFIASLLFGVKSHDVPLFLAAALLLTGVALAACYIPARRALRVDPIVALRHE